MYRRIFALVCLSLLTACASIDRQLESMLASGASIVELDVAEPNRLSGSYRDRSLKYGFELERAPDRVGWRLTSNEGRTLLDATWTDRTLEVQIRDSGFAVDRDALLAAGESAEARRLMRDFSDSAAFRSLPKLSRSLAMLGVTGFRFPASQPLHQAAESAEQIHGPATGGNGSGGEEPDDDPVPYMYANPYASQPTKIAVNQFDIIDEIYDCNVAQGPFEVDPVVLQARSDACSAGSCSLESDPNDDDCAGMCGLGCDCWEWVCGSCCSNWVCEGHDATVRDCAENGFSGLEILSCPAAGVSSVLIGASEIIGGGILSCGGLGLPFL